MPLLSLRGWLETATVIFQACRQPDRSVAHTIPLGRFFIQMNHIRDVDEEDGYPPMSKGKLLDRTKELIFLYIQDRLEPYGIRISRAGITGIKETELEITMIFASPADAMVAKMALA